MSDDAGGVVDALAAGLELPPQHLLTRRLPDRALADPYTTTRALLPPMNLRGRRVAIAVGSRGIDRIVDVVRAVVAHVREAGGTPVIVPAMGSHGGATAEGQLQVVAGMGIVEAEIGAPVQASMETVVVGETPRGTPVFVAQDFLRADDVILINRIKPHTDFASAVLGSGLLKMTVIGLGKADGAFRCHQAASRIGHETAIREAARVVLAKAPVRLGVALVEDERHHLAHVEVVPAAALEEREPALLAQARSWMPGLPSAQIDVLIVDEIGKDISGAGMDTNVIGRGVDGRPRSDMRVEIGALWVRGLTPATHGNAIGLGLADVVSQRVVQGMERTSTFVNALSAMVPATVRIPMHFPTERACLAAAVRMAGVPPSQARILRIRNTVALDRFLASPALVAECKERLDLVDVSPAVPWQFDPQGDLQGPAPYLQES